MMFLEASEWNVGAALEWVAAGMGKMYGGKAVEKFAKMAEAWAFKAEAEKAGWKFPAVSGPAWAMGAS